MKMWSGRFRQSLDPEFDRWQRSFPFDHHLLKFELQASRAHARALRKAGVLSHEELASILFGLDQIGEKPNPANDGSQDDVEDVHHFVEKELVAVIGDAGYKLHSGRSRNEQIATDLRLYVRGAIDEVRELLVDLLDTFVARAEASANAAMPAYTHLQPAEPVLVAHWLLAYESMFARDVARILDCRQRANLCPLGSGAVAGAVIPLDREMMSAELAFDAPTGNSMDATSDRDFALEFVSDLSIVALHLSRWAEEMILFSTQEFGFVCLPERYSTGSSAMPQKKNPDLLELIRGKAARVLGNAMALMVATKGLPLAYNKDLQETQEPIFEAAESVASSLRLAGSWMKDVQFDYVRMRSAADSGYMNAWAAATYLVQRGVPSRLAHEQVGKAVQYCLEQGCLLGDLSLDQLRHFSPSFGEDLFSSLRLESVLGIHDVPGGTAPCRVHDGIKSAKRQLAEMRGVTHAHA